MEKDWIQVYKSTDKYKAELLKQVLEEEGINAVLIDKQGYPYNIGYLEVFTHQDDASRALTIIEQNEF